MTFASREIDGGAAVRARAISTFRSVIKYWSSGAMLGYGTLASCASAGQAPSMKAPNAIVLITVRFIDIPFDADSKYTAAFKPVMRQSSLIVALEYRPVCTFALCKNTHVRANEPSVAHAKPRDRTLPVPEEAVAKYVTTLKKTAA